MKEIIFEIQNGQVNVKLGDGFPPGAEAVDVASEYLKTFDVVIEQHEPHKHAHRTIGNKIHISE